MTERAEAHKIAADVLASQHMRADRTVQALAPLAREFLKLSPEPDPIEAQLNRILAQITALEAFAASIDPNG